MLYLCSAKIYSIMEDAIKVLLKKELKTMLSFLVQLIGYSILGGLGGLILGLAFVGLLTILDER